MTILSLIVSVVFVATAIIIMQLILKNRNNKAKSWANQAVQPDLKWCPTCEGYVKKGRFVGDECLFCQMK